MKNKFRYKLKDENKLLYDQDEEFGYLHSSRTLITGSMGEMWEVEDEMQFTNFYDTEIGTEELYEKDIMEYQVLGEKRRGIIVKRESGEWAIETDPGWSIGLISALIESNAVKIGNWYENREMLDN
jgi:hypothetical protein